MNASITLRSLVITYTYFLSFCLETKLYISIYYSVVLVRKTNQKPIEPLSFNHIKTGGKHTSRPALLSMKLSETDTSEDEARYR